MGVDLELDLSASIGDIVRREMDAAIHPLFGPQSERIVAIFSGQVGAGGGVGFRVYDVPDGKTFMLYKYICWDDAKNPSTGAVYSNAAAWCGIFHGIPGAANLADFWPKPEAATGQVLPFTWEFNDKNGPEFRQNDIVYFQGVGLPVGDNITLLIFGDLIDLAGRPGAGFRRSGMGHPPSGGKSKHRRSAR